MSEQNIKRNKIRREKYHAPCLYLIISKSEWYSIPGVGAARPIWYVGATVNYYERMGNHLSGNSSVVADYLQENQLPPLKECCDIYVLDFERAWGAKYHMREKEKREKYLYDMLYPLEYYEKHFGLPHFKDQIARFEQWIGDESLQDFTPEEIILTETTKEQYLLLATEYWGRMTDEILYSVESYEEIKERYSRTKVANTRYDCEFAKINVDDSLYNLFLDYKQGRKTEAEVNSEYDKLKMSGRIIPQNKKMNFFAASEKEPCIYQKYQTQFLNRYEKLNAKAIIEGLM